MQWIHVNSHAHHKAFTWCLCLQSEKFNSFIMWPWPWPSNDLQMKKQYHQSNPDVLITYPRGTTHCLSIFYANLINGYFAIGGHIYCFMWPWSRQKGINTSFQVKLLCKCNLCSEFMLTHMHTIRLLHVAFASKVWNLTVL